MPLMLLLCLFLPGVLASVETVTSPSQEEVFILQQVNLLRTDFLGEQRMIIAAAHEKRIVVSRHFDHFWTMVVSNTAAKPCPLAYSPALMTAARALLESGQAAPEKKTFDATASVRAAGYDGADAVACFAKDAPDLAAAFAAAATNVVGEDPRLPAYIVPQYAADIMCKSAWRELGIAVSSAKGRYNLVIVFGAGGGRRPIGGVVYTDTNCNRRFDPGEGRAGVPVSIGASRTTSGPGGAWCLDSERGSESTVIIGSEGIQRVRTVATDAVTAQLDWRMPTQAELKPFDALIADAVKAAACPDAEKRVGPLAALLVGSRMLELDEVRAGKVAQLVGPVVDLFELMRSQILQILAEDPKEATKKIETQRKRWNGALSAWFKEASRMVTLRQQVNAARGAQPGQGGALAKPLLSQLEKAIVTTTDDAFRALYTIWMTDLEALNAKPAGGATAEPGKKK